MRAVFALLLAIAGMPETALAQQASAAQPTAEAIRAAQAAFNEGMTKWNRSQPADALADFDRAVALTPTSPMAHAGRAIALADMRRYAEADAAIATALRLRETNAFVQFGAGYVHLKKGEFPAAVEAYTRALQLQPGNPDWLNLRAEAYESMGQMDLALADLDRIVAASPDSASAYFERARILAHWRGDRQADALAAIDRAIAAAPRASAYRIWRGDFLYIFGRRDEAAASYRDALTVLDRRIAATDGHPEPWMVETRLNLLGRSGRYAEAIRILDAELGRMPDNAAVLGARCWLRMEGNIELPLALADCEAALRADPAQPVAGGALPRLYLRLQRWTDAEHAFDDQVQRGTRSEANALYGRGIARIRQGNGAAGERDRRDARRRRFDVADDFIRFGLDIESAQSVPAAR